MGPPHEGSIRRPIATLVCWKHASAFVRFPEDVFITTQQSTALQTATTANRSRITCLRMRFPSTMVPGLNGPVSPETVKRLIRAAGINCRRPYVSAITELEKTIVTNNSVSNPRGGELQTETDIFFRPTDTVKAVSLYGAIHVRSQNWLVSV